MAISTITGYCAVGQVAYGSNGDSNGTDHEYEVLDAAGNGVSGRRQWDQDLSGIDSGNVDLTLAAEPGGGTNGVSWSVAGGATFPLTFDDVTYGAITGVKVRSAVTGPGLRMKLSSIVVRFYKNGTLQEKRTLMASADANTLGQGSSDSVESIIDVIPSAADNDKVTVTAVALLKSDAGVYPGAMDIFGQMFVFCGSCATV